MEVEPPSNETEPDVGVVAQAIACGDDSKQEDVEKYRNWTPTTGISTEFVQARERAVGITSAYTGGGEPNCSGTLIANDLFLTAGHCQHEVGGWVTFNYQAVYSDDLEAPPLRIDDTESYPIIAILGHSESFPLDVEVLRLGGNPGARWPITRVRAQTPELGEWTTMIGHPHNRLTTFQDGSLALALKMVTQGPVMSPSGGYMRTDANGGVGTSGSGVLNADGEIIAVNSGYTCYSRSPITLALAYWQQRGLTELTQLVLPSKQSPCFTATPSATVSAGGTPGTFYGSTSPNGLGAYGFAGCPYTWVVEVTNIAGKNVSAQSLIASRPTSETGCHATLHTTVIKGYRNKAWTMLTSQRTTPEWDGGACIGTANRYLVSGTAGYTKLRIATRVESGSIHSEGGPNLQRVSAGVTLQ